VCSAWNEFMLSQHARRSGQIKYVVYANDQANSQPLTNEQRLAIAHLKLDHTYHLAHKIELVIGMNAMVTTNISPEMDLANGSRGNNSTAIPTCCSSLQTTVLSKPTIPWFAQWNHSHLALTEKLQVRHMPLLISRLKGRQ